MVVRLPNDGAQILGTELSPHDIGSWCEHSPAGHHLDDVHAAIHPLAYRCRNLSTARNLASEEMAVPIDAGQGRTRRHNRGLWMLCAAVALLVTARDGRIANVTKITNSGHAGGQLSPQAFSDDRVQCIGAEPGDAIQRADLAVCDKMNMGVDEARQHRRARVVIHLP